MALTNPSDHQNPPDPNKMEDDEEEYKQQNPPLSLSLAGKLLTSQKPNLGTFKHRISRLWDCPNNLDVHHLGRGIYLFHFHRLEHKLRIFNGGPWHYQDGLILLSEYHHHTPPEQIHFTKAKLWVRIHDLPPMCINHKYAEAIAAKLGRHCQTDIPKEDDTPEIWRAFLAKAWGKFLRVKVEVDLSKPLVAQLTMHVKRGDQLHDFQHDFSYERLPEDFCYACGLIGHVYRECSMLRLVQNNLGSLPYSEKIRAEKYYSK